ncbi:hypothetical protein CDAR_212261 [Caerostris darwini]|uniref:Uncharacterized protein n=1 Tax=Caerostris darwini TaxID=1538125 RepID=A0AAV4R9I7_9ARAC|nr:hypothetical protein CDAR_212261 [Caerostris darwini]
MTISSECRQALAKTIGKLQPYKRGVLAREEQYPYEIPELSIRTTMLPPEEKSMEEEEKFWRMRHQQFGEVGKF